MIERAIGRAREAGEIMEKEKEEGKQARKKWKIKRGRERNEGRWRDAPTGFLSLPTLCLPAGERFRSTVLKLPSGGFHLLCVCVCLRE